MSEVNYGISGVGALSARNVVVGPSGSIVDHGSDERPDVVADHLEALLAALEAYDGPAETRARLAAPAAEVTAELQGNAPDRRNLTERLTAIRDAAGSASAVAAAASALIGVVQQVF
jgi:hypothetical protein